MKDLSSMPSVLLLNLKALDEDYVTMAELPYMLVRVVCTMNTAHSLSHLCLSPQSYCWSLIFLSLPGPELF